MFRNALSGKKSRMGDDWWSKMGYIPASRRVVSRSQVSAPLMPKYESVSTRGTTSDSKQGFPNCASRLSIRSIFS